MKTVFSTDKGIQRPNRKWSRTFVFFGKVLLQESCDTIHKRPTPDHKESWVFLRSLYTRVTMGFDDDTIRIWCTPEVHQLRTTEEQRKNRYRDVFPGLESDLPKTASN